MTHRQRVLRMFRFEQTDRPACDLMEAVVWPEFQTYCQQTHGLDDSQAVIDWLDPDFRWIAMRHVGPEGSGGGDGDQDAPQSRAVVDGPLAGAETVAEVEAFDFGDPALWEPPDFAAFARRWPDHARVFCPGWYPLFWGACQDFGMEAGLVKMLAEPELIEAYLRRRSEVYMDRLSRGLAAAGGHCDICWLGDDYAGQQDLIIDPALWRRLIKPRLAEHVRMVRDHGLAPMLHSCGAIRDILGDLIDIGVAAVLVFQTSARGMDPESIAAEFGGKLVFYGGLDVQQLLSFASPEQVRAEVRRNVRAFRDCGGYVVANSHHCIATVRGENVEAMFDAARNP